MNFQKCKTCRYPDDILKKEHRECQVTTFHGNSVFFTLMKAANKFDWTMFTITGDKFSCEMNVPIS